MEINTALIEQFRRFLHVREATGTNDGARVEAIQRWSGGKKGDSWCAWLFIMVLDLVFVGKSPFPRDAKFGSCDEVYALAKEKGWLRELPHVGDGYLFMTGEDAHHIGMVTDAGSGTFKGIAGNTSENGKSSNGTGCFEHEFTINPATMKFIAYPR
jgi:hypothetical protein